MRPTLRDYQSNYCQQTKLFFQGDDNKNLLLVMPTGTGKTTVFSSLTADWLARGYRTLIAVHRIELVDQIVERLGTFDIQAGIIGGDYTFDPELPVQVGMVQSIPKDSGWYPDYIVIDECHHSVANSYQRLWEIFPMAKILGVTATPIRLDGRGFSDLYQRMLNLYPLEFFFEKEHLVRPVHYFCADIPQGTLKKVQSDYSIAEQARYLIQHRALSEVVQTYQKYSPGKKAVVFAVNIDHSTSLVTRFNEMGISAAHLDGEVPKDERKRIIAGFRSGLYQVLCNYDLISEGFDCPDIDTVILARRSKSLAAYIQAIGRCLRPDVKSGKKFGYVLDCAGQWLDHGFAGLDYPWKLDMNRGDVIQFVGKQRLFHNTKKSLKTILESPKELIGMNLVQADEEIKRTGMFEKYLHDLQKGEETNITPATALEAFLCYCDWMEVCGNIWSTTELYYLKMRLKKFKAEIPKAVEQQILKQKDKIHDDFIKQDLNVLQSC